MCSHAVTKFQSRKIQENNINNMEMPDQGHRGAFAASFNIQNLTPIEA